MGEHIRLETDTAPGVATIRLDRPKVNAIDSGMVADLTEICAELAGATDVRSVVVWGGPRVFAAGADIEEFPSFDRAGALDFSHRINAALLALEHLPQITIAAVAGYALGGGLEVALSTDFRMAADNARLGVPEIQLGIIPGGGGTQRLARLAGVTMAKEMVYTGRHIGADEAKTSGIVSSIHDPDSLYDDAVAKAVEYAKGPASLKMAKEAILEGLHLPLAEAVAVEAEKFADAFDTDDARTGIRSFMESGPGKAEFTGR